MYKLTVESHFSAAHRLEGYPGKCANIHGHTWRVIASVRADELDDIGMCIDFKKISRSLDEIVEGFDHRMLNEIPPFAPMNPTAENISRIIFERLSERINSDMVTVVSVTVSESDKYRVTYSRSTGDDT